MLRVHAMYMNLSPAENPISARISPILDRNPSISAAVSPLLCVILSVQRLLNDLHIRIC
jgi:hypothetical protein